MSTGILLFISLLIVTIFIGGPYAWQLYIRHRRTRLLRRIAKQMDFVFHRDYRVGCYDLEGMENITAPLRDAGIHNLCFSFKNILTAKRKGIKWLIFDAGYGKRKTGSARYLSTYFQAEVPETLPELKVTLKRISSESTAFHETYDVEGDAKHTRLSKSIMKEFLKVPLAMQAGGHLVQFHLPIASAKPDRIPELFSHMEHVLQLVRSSLD